VVLVTAAQSFSAAVAEAVAVAAVMGAARPISTNGSIIRRVATTATVAAITMDKPVVHAVPSSMASRAFGDIDATADAIADAALAHAVVNQAQADANPVRRAMVVVKDVRVAAEATNSQVAKRGIITSTRPMRFRCRISNRRDLNSF